MTYSSAREVPGRAMGVAAFAVSFFLPVVGIVLGIVASAQSRRVGEPNPWAVAAIAVGVGVLVAAGITSIVLWG